MSNISERIKLLRNEKGITQAELARVIGLSKIAVVGYENNRREPNSKAMAALEDFFQVSGKYLRGETDERNIPEAKQVNKHKQSVNQEISIRIKALRKELDITQKQLSDYTGIAYQSIVNYELGRREPNSKAMAILEKFFGVSGAVLRGEEEISIKEPNVHDDTLARTLRRLRLKTGMTQRDLAECTGLSYAAIRSYEAGRREPGSRAIALLEEFFEVSGAYLRGETEERMSGVTKQSSNSQHFTPSEIDLLYNLVHKEIMCAERLADIYDLSGKANEDVKGELLKLAVKINEMKGY